MKLELPKHSVYNEMAILGCFLIDGELFKLKRELLKEEFFYSSVCITIYRAIKKLDKSGMKIDLVTLHSHLDTTNQVDKIGGISFLAELTEIVPTTSHIDSYIKTIIEDYRYRELQKFGEKIHSKPQEGLKLLKEIDSLLLELDKNHSDIKKYSLFDMFDLLGEESKKVSTGYKELDSKLSGGFEDSRLYTIAGRPGNGKSMFGLNLACNLAHSVKTIFISLEMPLKHISHRVVSILSNSGLTSEEKVSSIDDRVIEKLGDNLYITDEGYRLNDIFKIYRANSDTKVIIIDYLSFIKVEGSFNRKDEEIGEITRSLKRVAKENNITIILLAQLNREASNGLPQLHHLKNSGDIEQDSDVVLLLDKGDEFSEELRVIVAKNRDGSTGEIKLKADFRNYKLSDYQEPHKFTS